MDALSIHMPGYNVVPFHMMRLFLLLLCSLHDVRWTFATCTNVDDLCLDKVTGFSLACKYTQDTASFFL